MKPEIEDVGDWRQRFAQIASKGFAQSDEPPRQRLSGGTARKLSRCVEWYGEDWCGISGP